MAQIYEGIESLKRAGFDQQMWSLRYNVFVKERGWSLPHRENFERDCYDNKHARYIVSTDHSGLITGSVRLIPTTEDHLISDIFSYLVSEPDQMPRGSHVMEMTRYFVAPAFARRRSMVNITGEILCAMFEYARQESVSTILGVIDDWFLNQMLEMSWPVRPLGLPQPYGGGPKNTGGGTAVAVQIRVCDQIIQSTAQARNVQLPALMRTPTPASELRIPLSH